MMIYAAKRERTSPLWAAAFRAGYPGEAAISTGPDGWTGAVALFGSPQLESVVKRAQDIGVDWYYGDHGFFGRGHYFRAARNRRTADGADGNTDPYRFRTFNISIQQWRATGRHIIVCPNSEAYLARHGAANWVDETLRALRKVTDRPLRVRWKKDAERRPLRNDLTSAWAVVTFTSNAAVEAILAGVPAFCAAPCAGLTMGSGDLSKIETPCMPSGREQWAARLANNQWTLAEIARGDLWRAIGT